MSSIRINDVDMPKNCAECPILQTGSLEHYCPLAKESMWSIDTESGRHNNCPLSEIPTPHGRLIDADRLLRKCQKISTQAWKMKLHADVEITMNQFIDFVKQAPTIIEMEANK